MQMTLVITDQLNFYNPKYYFTVVQTAQCLFSCLVGSDASVASLSTGYVYVLPKEQQKFTVLTVCT